jgi:hypothetical protein
MWYLCGMRTERLPSPLQIAKTLGIPQRNVAAILRVSVGWLRTLGRDPRCARRVRVAVLEAALEREKERVALEEIERSLR